MNSSIGRRTVSVAAVRQLLSRPRALALVGASDNSQWSRSIFACVRGYGYDGPLVAINQRGVPAHGLPGYRSAREIPHPVDVAYVFVPAEAVCGALEDLAAAGVLSVVMLSSGFAEAGEQGKALQQQVTDAAERLGICLLGPNSLGFANIAGGFGVTALPPTEPLLPGRVAVISQSGAICAEIADYAVQQGIGLSFLCAVGNEAMVDASTVAEALVHDASVGVVALFVESIRDPAAFSRAAEAARRFRKALVVFKVGSSPAAAAVALAHTGSLVGDDRLFDAACRRHAVVRVDSLEGLVTTAGLLAHTGVIEKPGVALVSLSGGGCGVVADQADRLGIPMPAFSEATQEALRALLPSYASTLNPFDITGAAFRDPPLFAKCLRIVGDDPSVGLVIAGYSVFSDERRLSMRLPLVQALGDGLGALGPRGILSSAAVRPYSGAGLKAIRGVGIAGAFGGLDATLRAVAKALWWSRAVREPAPAGARDEAAMPARPQDEREVLDYLAARGVPVIPAAVVASAAEAASAQRRFGGAPVALKILSPDIAHKTEAGGVRLNVASADLAGAHASLLEAVRRHQPEARISGVIVSPMRAPVLELFVGVSVDAQWGPAIAVGLGGVWIEVLRDVSLRLLPVSREQARDMLLSLRAARLLQGWRGAPPADLDALADTIVRIGDAALALGPELVALEVNPLRVDGAAVEALDGLAVWKDRT